MTTPTTPAEAARLAEKHGASLFSERFSIGTGITLPAEYRINERQLAALIDEVRGLEREECAALCYHLGDGDPDYYDPPSSFECAAAIRARAAAEVGKEVGG